MEQRRKILLTLASGLLFLTFSTAIDNYDQVVNVGEPLEFSRTAEGSVPYCRFTVPNIMGGNEDNIESGINNEIPARPEDEAEEEVFSPARPGTWKYKWLEATTTRCHIKVLKTVPEDSGIWSFSSTGQAGDEEHTNILVQVAPEEPDPINIDDFEIDGNNGETVAMRDIIYFCKNANPMPTIKITLGGLEITNGNVIEIEEIYANDTSGTIDQDNKPDKDVLYTAKTTFNFTAKPEDDNKTLLYECNHPTLEEPWVLNNLITVHAPPASIGSIVDGTTGGKVGDPITLELQFHANPVPLEIKWFMHDLEGALVVPDVAEIINNAKASTTPEDNIQINGTRYEFGNSSWDGYTFTARLEVTELKGDDDGKISYVEVTNNYGRTNYTLHYQDLDKGMSAGVIAGIVIGVVLGVIILAALAFLLFKKTKSKGKRSKNIDQKTAEFHGNPEPTPRSVVNVTVEMDQSTPQVIQGEGSGQDNPTHQTD